MSNDCPFCDFEEAIVNGKLAYARYDKYPVSKGHILIVPKRHVSDFFNTTNDEKIEFYSIIDKCKSMIDELYSPDGYNIGINVGETAGQTVMHVHIHLIPRYQGDMDEPRGGVRGVIPEKRIY